MSPEMPIALLAGVVLGASAHRAGLCTVKAIGEVLTTRKAHLLWSFLKVSLWTTGLLAGATALGYGVELGQRPILVSCIAGGLIFGLGAGLNGACSFSTLSRLAEGHIVMLFTLIGWIVSISLFEDALPHQHPAPSGFVVPAIFAVPLTFWMLWELWRIWQHRWAINASFQSGFLALSPAALLIAVANGALILVGRPWSFTSTALCSARDVPLAPCKFTTALWSISMTAFLTMFASALIRRSFRLRRPKANGAARHLVAGLIMGLGASLIPGGNDGLVLFGIPALSPHAFPSWLAIAAGVAATLTFMQGLGMRLPKISCDDDICRSIP